MNLICINCPKGCHLTVEEVDGEIDLILQENGILYPIEIKMPVRTALIHLFSLMWQSPKMLCVINSARKHPPI